MYKPKSKRHNLIMRTVVSTVMTIAVLLISTILLLLMLGYRFNKDQGTFQQGGLVQFITTPTGAKVTVGTAHLANLTPSKITLMPGTYAVNIDKKGYRPWNKAIAIKPGAVLWLNSARLIPQTLQTEKIVEYPHIAAVEFSPAGKYAAILENDSKSTITLLEIDQRTAKSKELALPEAIYSKGSSHKFSFGDWGPAERYLTMKHDYDGKTEWLVVDTKDLTKSSIVPSVEEAHPEKVVYDPRSNTALIVLYTDGSVRTYQTQTGELSPAMLQNIASFSFINNQHLLYATKPTEGVVTTGYLTLGTETPRTIKSYATNESVTVAAARYFDTYNFATSVGHIVHITSVRDVPSSNSSEPWQSEKVIDLNLPQNAIKADTHAGGRFIAILQPNTETVYDLELKKQSDVTIQRTSAPLAELDWFDDYNFWNSNGGVLRQYEFDGTNQHDILPVIEGMPATFSGNNKYLYSVGKTSSGYQLQVTTMILD